MKEKLKSLIGNDGFFTSLLVLLVGLVSFGLGRLSVQDIGGSMVAEGDGGGGVVVSTFPVAEISPASVVKASESPAQTAIAVVASKSGKKYHLPDCPGAKQIKPANLIRFESIDLARAAGYTPASNCPGLE